jgi:hypothetical protein
MSGLPASQGEYTSPIHLILGWRAQAASFHFLHHGFAVCQHYAVDLDERVILHAGEQIGYEGDEN